MKLFISTKAFISYRGKILILREAEEYEDGISAGRYEIPGGRIELGQRFDESLLREINEEAGLKNIKIGKPFHVDEYHPVIRNEKWQVVAIFFKCTTKANQVKLGRDFDEYQWINPKDYKKYDLKSASKRAFEEFNKIH